MWIVHRNLVMTNQAPCHSFPTTALPAHQLSPFAISLLSWQTPRPCGPVQCIATDLSQPCFQTHSQRLPVTKELVCLFPVSRVWGVATNFASSSDKVSTNASTWVDTRIQFRSPCVSSHGVGNIVGIEPTCQNFHRVVIAPTPSACPIVHFVLFQACICGEHASCSSLDL